MQGEEKTWQLIIWSAAPLKTEIQLLNSDIVIFFQYLKYNYFQHKYNFKEKGELLH